MKQDSFKSSLFGLAVMLAAIGCEKDPKIEPNPHPLPPQQELPNPLPPNALVKQLKKTDIDHETFTYNTRGQVVQLRAQWQYDQSDPTKIRTIVYDFEYDTQDRPVRVSTPSSYFSRYFYHDTLVERSQELYPGGEVAREVTYIYYNSRIIKEIWRVSNLPSEPVTLYKHEFEYDAKGNLAEIKVFEQVTDSTSGQQQYKLLETLEYSNFDDKINPTSWMLRYPFLPQVRWHYNNPRREVRRLPGGTVQVTTHEYQYNAEGLPISRRTTSPGGMQTTNYQY